MAVAHAPAGGVSIGGKDFKGGEFVPGETQADVDKAAGEGGGAKKQPHEMTKEEFDKIPREKLKSDVFFLGRRNDIEVIQNPSSRETSELIREVRKEFPSMGGGDVKIRFTQDDNGNRWIWKAHLATHGDIEPDIEKKTGNKVNQNAEVLTHKKAVREAIREGLKVPKEVQKQYPQWAGHFAKRMNLRQGETMLDAEQFLKPFKALNTKQLEALGADVATMVANDRQLIAELNGGVATDPNDYQQELEAELASDETKAVNLSQDKQVIAAAAKAAGLTREEEALLRESLQVDRMAVAHAPAGGVAVGGKEFRGGEFIPGEVIEKATTEEKAAIEGKPTSDKLGQAGPKDTGPVDYANDRKEFLDHLASIGDVEGGAKAQSDAFAESGWPMIDAWRADGKLIAHAQPVRYPNAERPVGVDEWAGGLSETEQKSIGAYVNRGSQDVRQGIKFMGLLEDESFPDDRRAMLNRSLDEVVSRGLTRRELAENVLSVIDAAPKSEQTTYRGVSVDDPQEFIAGLQADGLQSNSLLSTTKNINFAAEVTKQKLVGADEFDRRTNPDQGVLMEIVGEGADLSSPLPYMNETEQEVLYGSTSFEVESVGEHEGIPLVRLRQVKAGTRLANAPKGGVTIGGKFFKGGQFIPKGVLEGATTEEKAAVEGKAPTTPSTAPTTQEGESVDNLLTAKSSAFVPLNAKGKFSWDQHQDDEGKGPKWLQDENDAGRFHWSPDRQKLHKQVVQSFFKDVTPVKDPTFHLMGGGPASGKSTVLDAGNIDLDENTMTVDSDAIKALLPEYREKLEAKDNTAAAFAHEESSFLAKAIMGKSLTEGYNTNLDGTGDGTLKGLTKKVDAARAAGMKVNANYMSIATDLSVKIANARAKATGRFVPESIIRNTHRSVSQILPEAMTEDLYDDVNLWDNNVKGEPRLVMSKKRGEDAQIHDEALWKDFVAKGSE